MTLLKVFSMIAVVTVASPLGWLRTPPERANERGLDEYREGDYGEATRSFGQAGRAAPEAAEIHYNEGAARYRAGDYAGAEEAFGTAADVSRDPDLKERSLYGRGNAAFGQEEYARAIERYDEALKIKPNDADARHNRELAEQMLEQEKDEKDRQSESPSQDQAEDGQNSEDQKQPPPQPRSGSGASGPKGLSQQPSQQPPSYQPPSAEEQQANEILRRAREQEARNFPRGNRKRTFIDFFGITYEDLFGTPPPSRPSDPNLKDW